MLCAGLDFILRGFNQALDFLGRLRAALRQTAYFARYHRKALALLTGTGGFHGGVQSQNIGLESNTVNHVNDVCHLAGTRRNLVHGIDHGTDRLPTLASNLGGVMSQLVCLMSIVCVLAHRAGQFFQTGRRFLQGGGLLFGTGTQVGIACKNLRGT